jgi:hypothetical protein
MEKLLCCFLSLTSYLSPMDPYHVSTVIDVKNVSDDEM